VFKPGIEFHGDTNWGGGKAKSWRSKIDQGLQRKGWGGWKQNWAKSSRLTREVPA